jgi:hypothetical protein
LLLSKKNFVAAIFISHFLRRLEFAKKIYSNKYV